jgi:hypothetical protein
MHVAVRPIAGFLGYKLHTADKVIAVRPAGVEIGLAA